MAKVRGFQKISQKQFDKDISSDTPISYQKIKLPERATARSAGYDIYSPIDFVLLPRETILIPTCIKAYMQDNEVLLAFVRSSLGFKYSVQLTNSVGVIDADYYNNKDNEGHIWVKLQNHGKENFIGEAGKAIAQLMFTNYLLADDDMATTTRNGGIGSTNEK